MSISDYEAIAAVVWIVFLGICFGAFYAYYYRRVLGDLLRAFITAGAEDEKTAKTLTEIGYGSGIKKIVAGIALKKKSGLRRTIEAVYEEEDAPKKTPDELFVRKPKLSVPQKYYVPEERRIAAEIRYDGEGTTSATLLLTVAVFFVAAIVAMSLIPWIINNSKRILNGGSGGETEIVSEISDSDINESGEK